MCHCGLLLFLSPTMFYVFSRNIPGIARAEVKIMRGQRFAETFPPCSPGFFAVTRNFFAQILGKALKLNSTLAVKIDTRVTKTYGAEKTLNKKASFQFGEVRANEILMLEILSNYNLRYVPSKILIALLVATSWGCVSPHSINICITLKVRAETGENMLGLDARARTWSSQLDLPIYVRRELRLASEPDILTKLEENWGQNWWRELAKWAS